MAAALRPAVLGDVPALAALYAETARVLGPWCYSAEQVGAWQRFAADEIAFRAYVLGADTWVAFDAERRPLGFSGLGTAGEVHSLYVRHDQVRRGVGTRLLDHTLARGAARGLTAFGAWATPFSLPVFRRAGFTLVRTVSEPFQGVMFERYRVERFAASG
jgi:putative acetyltransferase